jgi:hypothetical protein
MTTRRRAPHLQHANRAYDDTSAPLTGYARGQRRLSTEDVAHIRMWLKLGYKGVVVARVYGLSTAYVSHIKNGRARVRR